jgi:hypothetical protein
LGQMTALFNCVNHLTLQITVKVLRLKLKKLDV